MECSFAIRVRVRARRRGWSRGRRVSRWANLLQGGLVGRVGFFGGGFEMGKEAGVVGTAKIHITDYTPCSHPD